MAAARHPTRWRFAIPVLAASGASCNILIAWIFIFWTPPPGPGSPATRAELVHARSGQDLRDHLPRRILAFLPQRSDEQLKRRPLMILIERRRKFAVGVDTLSFLGREVTIVSGGFPFRSLSYTTDRPRFATAFAVDTHWGIYFPGLKPSWPGGLVSPAPLPLRPATLPFLANTLIYALLLAIAWRGLRRISKSGIAEHRRQHGRCIACGYDLTRIPGNLCPECGSPALAQRAAG